MSILVGMIFTVSATGLASLNARFNLGADAGRGGPPHPRKDSSRGGAGVCTVEVHADAIDQLAGRLFAETRVGAGSTGLCALKACINAVSQYVSVNRGGFGMHVEYFFRSRGGWSLHNGDLFLDECVDTEKLGRAFDKAMDE